MLSIIYGGITHHYLASNLPYCNRINNAGSIHNEYVIALAGNEDFKIGALSGKDSACGNIFGPIVSARVSDNTDLILGGYNTNFEKFHQLGIEPPSYDGITPVVGINWKIPIYESDSFKIKLNNLISVGIITHAVSIDF